MVGWTQGDAGDALEIVTGASWWRAYERGFGRGERMIVGCTQEVNAVGTLQAAAREGVRRVCVGEIPVAVGA